MIYESLAFWAPFLEKLGQLKSASSAAFSPGEHGFVESIITRWV